MFLEKVIVAPVYLSSIHNRPHLPWEHRHAMVKHGLKSVVEAEVIDQSLKPALSLGIEKAFSKLKRQKPALWTHIAGGDAYERFCF